MSRIDDLARDIAELRRDLRNARLQEADAAVSAAQRRHTARLAVREEELRQAWRRLDPDTSLLRWQPRAGEPVEVDIGAGLLQRLRSADPVADSLGNADTYTGMANQVDDPAFENYTDELVTLTTTEQAVGRFLYPGSSGTAWWASKTAGTNALCRTQRLIERANLSNPFNSAAVLLNIGATGAASHEIMVRTGVSLGAGELVLPYLVASVRVFLEASVFGNVNTNVTSRTLVLEIYDVTDAVVRGTSSVDLQPLVDDGLASALSTARLTAAVLLAGQAWAGHIFRLRIRLLMTTSGGTGTSSFLIGEPMAQLSYSPDVGFYQPTIGLWVPKVVANRSDEFTSDLVVGQRATEANRRYSADTSGFTSWGSGAAAQDVALWRSKAAELRIDSGSTPPGALAVNDIVPHKAAAWAIAYNGDGTVASATRSGDAGAATTTVAYSGAHIASVVSVRAGRTVTVIPTYTGDLITGLSRTVV